MTSRALNQSGKILKLKARTALMGKYAPCIILISFLTSITLLLEWLLDISGFSPTGDTFQQICYILMYVIILLLESILSVGLTRFFLQLTLKQPTSFTDLFYCFTHDPDRFILAAALVQAPVIAAQIPMSVYLFRLPAFAEWTTQHLVTLAGLELFSLLVSMVTSLFLGQSFYILLEDSKCGILESLKRSCQLMKGHKRRLFALYLSFFLYALLTLGTFGLGS
ncbi:MAG: DUF975 family protein, partial [Lachnospiraceae bacterium]|nr:DUF975 family protein [Lachnospiraceae bacterium]